MNVFQKAFLLFALFFPLTTSLFADNPNSVCGQNKKCDVNFTAIPIVDGATSCATATEIVGPYTITSNLPFSIGIGAPQLIILSGDTLPADILTISSTTCGSSLAAYASCDIFLSLASGETGTLNRELLIPINTEQRQLTATISADITSSCNAFIANQNGDSIASCTLGAGELFNQCTGLDAYGIAFQTITTAQDASTTYAYLTNEFDNTVLQCTLIPSGTNVAQFSGCVDSGAGDIFNFYPSDLTQGIPSGIEFEPTGSTTYAYMVNGNNTGTEPNRNSVTKCELNSSTGQFENCADSGAGSIFNVPTQIAFQYLSSTSTNYAFVVNSNNNTITSCTVGATGQFSSCGAVSITGVTLDTPLDIGFQTLGGVIYAYITNGATGNNTVSFCTVNNSGIDDGDFTSCASTGSDFTLPTGIAFSDANSSDILYAYVTNSVEFATSVTICDVGATGVLTSCGNAMMEVLDGDNPHAMGIVFQPVNGETYAYVVDNDRGTIQECLVSSAGLLNGNTHCYGTFFNEPDGIAFQVFNGVNYLYAANNISDVVTQCIVDPATAQISGCQNAGPSAFAFTAPAGIAFEPVGSAVYAYVTNGDAILQCRVDPLTGQFTACNDSGAGSIFNNPIALAFVTLEDITYAYVANADVFPNNTVIRCEVTAGQFQASSCQSVGGNFANHPAGIAIQSITNANVTTTYAYVTAENGGVTKCTIINSSGIFDPSSCALSGSNFLSPAGIAIITLEGIIYAYVTNFDGGNATQCTIDDAGNLTACTQTPTGEEPFDFPFGIAFL